MQERRRPEKTRPLPELERAVSEILVTHGRSPDPFTKTFSYSGENIVKSNLGILVGLFEIDERSEESAYIVNHLASVAKKEYFANPRRGAIESFETTLHKVNIALAEFVRHGSVAWLGKLHGALAVFEKNSVHFSAAGDARILLFRNDAFTDIGEGLVSEASKLHPIKTFTEIASGRLLAEDKVILALPELFSLFSLEELRRSALRMDRAGFARFVKTALVNEFDRGGAIIIDLQEGRMEQARPTHDTKNDDWKQTSREEMYNVFSQTTFVPQKPDSVAVTIAEESEQTDQNNRRDYTDTKTQHIYVQGRGAGRPSSSPFLDHLRLKIQDGGYALETFILARTRSLRHFRRYAGVRLASIADTGKIVLRNGFRKLKHALRSRNTTHDQPPAPPTEVLVEEVRKTETAPKEDFISGSDVPDEDAIPPFLRDKIAAFYRKTGRENEETSAPEQTTPPSVRTLGYFLVRLERKIGSGTSSAASFLRFRAVSAFRRGSALTASLRKNWGQMMPHRKRLILGSITLVTLLGAIGLVLSFRHTGSNETSSSPEPSPSTAVPDRLLIDQEANAFVADVPITLATTADPAIASLVLDSDVYLITAHGIMNVRTDQTYPLSETTGSIRFAAPMDDLRLIFVCTEDNRLFAWSPITRAFTENRLALPEGAVIRDIGTYLTYFYLLDSRSGQLLRFPRAEGGFGAPTSWFREGVPIGDAARMTVNETVYVSPDRTSIKAFFRGRNVRDFELPNPNTPLSVAALFSHPGLKNLYALDRDNRRLLVWNEDGHLLVQYFSDRLADATSLSVNETTAEAYVTVDRTLLSFKLNHQE